jgi:hypothetical protein
VDCRLCDRGPPRSPSANPPLNDHGDGWAGHGRSCHQEMTAQAPGVTIAPPSRGHRGDRSSLDLPPGESGRRRTMPVWNQRRGLVPGMALSPIRWTPHRSVLSPLGVPCVSPALRRRGRSIVAPFHVSSDAGRCFVVCDPSVSGSFVSLCNRRDAGAPLTSRCTRSAP